MKEQIKALLLAHAKLNVDPATLADRDDLFEAGMSSLTSVDLMMALEDHFGIEFPNEMLNRRTFVTIDSIASAVGALDPSSL